MRSSRNRRAGSRSGQGGGRQAPFDNEPLGSSSDGDPPRLPGVAASRRGAVSGNCGDNPGPPCPRSPDHDRRSPPLWPVVATLRACQRALLRCIGRRRSPPGASEVARRIIAIANLIPPGRWTTYGDLAEVAGSPRASPPHCRRLHHLPPRLTMSGPTWLDGWCRGIGSGWTTVGSSPGRRAPRPRNGRPSPTGVRPGLGAEG